MREHILALGGTLSVASSEAGVTVEAIIPKGGYEFGNFSRS
jgi:signal transduction histidine kinase